MLAVEVLRSTSTTSYRGIRAFTLGEFVYRPGGPLAARGYRRVIAPPRMQNAGDYLTDVGFRPEGDAMVRDLA